MDNQTTRTGHQSISVQATSWPDEQRKVKGSVSALTARKCTWRYMEGAPLCFPRDYGQAAAITTLAAHTSTPIAEKELILGDSVMRSTLHDRNTGADESTLDIGG